MTGRERLFAALRGEPTDRVPVWLLFPFHRLGCYVDVRRHPKYQPVHEAAERHAITLNRRSPGVPLHSEEVARRQEESGEEKDLVVRNYVEFGGERICSETRRGPDGVRVRKLLSSDEDLDFWLSLPIETDADRIESLLDRQWPRHEEERREFPPDLGAMMLDLGEPINALYHASDLEQYAMWSLTRSDEIVAFLDRAMAQKRAVYRYWLERDAADVYFLVGSELASPPLVSRETFQRWIVPHARELIDLVHGYGKKVIQHYHGQIAAILPDFLTMGPDALHTIESPPIGDCPLQDAFEAVGDRMTLIGNVQYDEFRSRTPDQMAHEVRALIEECRGRRFILSPTAGPFEEGVSDRVIENYHAFLQTAATTPW